MPASAGLVIHDADAVLHRFTTEHNGILYFLDPDGERYELVTRIDDPAISYQGGGAFFPVASAQVAEALRAIQFPLDDLDGEVFILPYPRRARLDSEANGSALILSPGVWPLTDSQVHMLLAHEVGHLVQHAFMPDGDRAAWTRYRALRSIEDVRIYDDAALHRDRPHEIFAEDFRVLLGGNLAAGSGRVENPDLIPPADIPGLQSFMLGLTESLLPIPRARIVALPNPAQAGRRVTFALAGHEAESGDIFVYDVEGRCLARLPLSTGVRTSWDGSLENRLAPPGFYVLRAQSGSRTWTGKLLIIR